MVLTKTYQVWYMFTISYWQYLVVSTMVTRNSAQLLELSGDLRDDPPPTGLKEISPVYIYITVYIFLFGLELRLACGTLNIIYYN